MSRIPASGRTAMLTALALVVCICACTRETPVTPDEARSIAEEAFIYAYPMLYNYKTMYEQAVDPTSPSYVGGFNRFRHYTRTYTAKDVDVITPNNDTPYSWAWLDLRAGPIVVSVPRVSRDRYYVMQWFDLYTHNFAYIGTRATGPRSGMYLIVGPHWTGEIPAGIKEVFRPETEIVGTVTRTSLEGRDDMDAVKGIQEHYRLIPLRDLPSQAPAEPAPVIDFPAWREDEALSAQFISYLNFLLQFAEPHPSESSVLARFARIGIGAGLPFDPGGLDAAMLGAIEEGVALGLERIDKAAGAAMREGGTSASYFGSREFLGNDYLKRAVGVKIGIYGNSMEEAIYLATESDADGHNLHGRHDYVLRFEPDGLPPAHFFWSVTMYRLPERLLVENPIGRYSIGDRTEGLEYGEDGSLEIYLQTKAPIKKKRANWLPTPDGPFFMVTRIYGPGPEAISGEWRQPLPVKAK